MIAQSRGSAMAQVSGAELGPDAQRVFECRAGEQRRDDSTAEYVSTTGGIAHVRKGGWMQRGSRDPLRPDGVAREVCGAASTQRHTQRRAPLMQRRRRSGQWIAAKQRHFVFVQLHEIEAAEPLRRLGQGAMQPESVRLAAEKQAMQVRIYEAREAASQQLRGLECQLETRNEIDIECIEVVNQRSELGPGPGRHAAAHLLAAPLGRLVAEGHPIVGLGHLDKTCTMGRVAQGTKEFIGPGCEVTSHFNERDDLPVVRKRRVEGGQRVGDAAPLLNRRLRRIAAVDRIPDHRSDYANTLQRSPQCFCKNTAAAPKTPAVPGSVPGTIRHASHAGLNARRLTSLRSGWNRRSPACVTPPQMTTTSGLKILRKLATAAPSNAAVSRTTSSAQGSPSFAASYTICAVSLDRSPFTYCASDVSTPDSMPSTARSAIAGPEA